MIRYTRNNKTISGRLLDEMVMMNLDQGKYFSLNRSATAIWEKLEKPMTCGELCSLLEDEFEVSADQCATEVKEYLDEMEKLGLVVQVRG